jgi:type I restriction enzyme M protein
MPVLGVIFLRHAANRFEAATRQIKEDQASGRMPRRPPIREDYVKRRALYLPEEAQYDWIMSLPEEEDLDQALIDAMTAIEKTFESLKGVLPKEFAIFERTVLEDLLRIFDREALRSAGGDLFGRIYEYFLMKFAIQGAQDNGEFFTPPSLVQTIVNVIEPDHGIVFDPASGSAGMFVQSSHFIERLGQDTAHRVTFYGQEKTATTIRLAKMNLAVHGLEGDIREANTFYEDVHTLGGKCDFVMANPPFNVDMVDEEKVKNDSRLPFGLPGVNKQKKVSNGNYLWISYFYSYLNATGRAGFVMSSQASSAGHGERDVRRKIVETGAVDVMIAIRSNFFYTRSVPCELWFFDRGKPGSLRDKVLMIDARNIYRKVTRKIYDFSPEQLQNLTAIIWLYRGKTDWFLGLVEKYLESVSAECSEIPEKLSQFEDLLSTLRSHLDLFRKRIEASDDGDAEKRQSLVEAIFELLDASTLYEQDRSSLVADIESFRQDICTILLATNDQQHAVRRAFDPISEKIKGLIKQIELLYKLASRGTELAGDLANPFPSPSSKGVKQAAFSSPLPPGEGQGEGLNGYDRREITRLIKQLDSARKETVEQLKQAVYFHRQVVWLQHRFPEAKLADVPGLVKLVNRKEIETADWSLTPGRYVGVAPAEHDEDFDFEAAMRDIHVELASLNEEAAELAAKIQANFEELGA